MTPHDLNPDYSPFWYRFGQGVTGSLFRLIGGLKVEGLEKLPRDRAVILAANHRSYIDPPVIGSTVPFPIFFFAKEELFRVPFVGWYIRKANSFPVKRSENDVGALKMSLRVLRAGYCLLMFPEGGRRLDPTRQWKARAGVGMIAAKTQAAVVPVGLINTERFGRFSRLRVRFGDAMEPPQEDGPEAYQKFADDVMVRIRELCS